MKNYVSWSLPAVVKGVALKQKVDMVAFRHEHKSLKNNRLIMLSYNV